MTAPVVRIDRLELRRGVEATHLRITTDARLLAKLELRQQGGDDAGDP